MGSSALNVRAARDVRGVTHKVYTYYLIGGVLQEPIFYEACSAKNADAYGYSEFIMMFPDGLLEGLVVDCLECLGDDKYAA